MVNTVVLTPPVQRSLGGATKPYIIGGNRFQFQRKQSTAAPGFNLMAVRWHQSPSVPIDSLVAVWFAGYQDQSLGLLPIGNDLTVSAAMMYPPANGPGSAKAFSKNGQYQFTCPNGGFVMSDPLSVYIPANAQYRLRSWVSPGSAGYIPYGMPCMGSSNGGELSGFGSTATDQVSYASGQADTTQASTSASTNATSDTCYEPTIIGMPSAQVPCFALLGDSLTYGALEVGVGGGATASGAGDALGNVGHWQRAIHLNGQEYLGMGISGSELNTWATPGYSNYIWTISRLACNRAIIALGTNDAGTFTTSVMLANIQLMVNQANLWANKVYIATLPPRVTTTDNCATLANQTVDTARTPTIDAFNAALLAGQITGATVIDIHGVYADSVQTDKWRVDGGAWGQDGTHPSIFGATQAAPLINGLLV